jgi:hypothetical protein
MAHPLMCEVGFLFGMISVFHAPVAGFIAQRVAAG